MVAVGGGGGVGGCGGGGGGGGGGGPKNWAPRGPTVQESKWSQGMEHRYRGRCTICRRIETYKNRRSRKKTEERRSGRRRKPDPPSVRGEIGEGMDWAGGGRCCSAQQTPPHPPTRPTNAPVPHHPVPSKTSSPPPPQPVTQRNPDTGVKGAGRRPPSCRRVFKPQVQTLVAKDSPKEKCTVRRERKKEG